MLDFARCCRLVFNATITRMLSTMTRTLRKPSRRSVIQNMFNIMLDYVAYFHEVCLFFLFAAILTACKKLVVKCSFIELGSSINHFYAFTFRI